MAHPLKDLQQLLKTKEVKTTGKVVFVGSATIKVATAGGVVELPRQDATSYKEGDSVLVRNGALFGKVVDESTLPIFII